MSAWLNDLVAIAEIHAAAASLGQLTSTGAIKGNVADWGIIAVLCSSASAKIVLSYFSGGRRYCFQVSIGLLLMIAGALLGKIIFT